jgi:hypothetical protein
MCIKAISELIKPRTVFDKILLAKEYKIKKWLRDGYLQLSQETDLKLADNICNSELDLKTIVRLLYLRERKYTI